MKYLQIDQVVEIHALAIERYGGLAGVRDENLLHSALHAPMASMFGEEMYPTVYDKAAVYLYHIIRNHPFNDGNKRTGFASAIAFLLGNNVPIVFSLYDLETVCVSVAKGNVGKIEISSFLKKEKA